MRSSGNGNMVDVIGKFGLVYSYWVDHTNVDVDVCTCGRLSEYSVTQTKC